MNRCQHETCAPNSRCHAPATVKLTQIDQHGRPVGWSDMCWTHAVALARLLPDKWKLPRRGIFARVPGPVPIGAG